MTIVTITLAAAEEIRTQLDIVAGEPDLMDRYGMTSEQAVQLYISVPLRGGLWHIPAFGIEAVKAEVPSLVQKLTVRTDLT